MPAAASISRRATARTVVTLVIEMVVVAALYSAAARLGLRLAFANRNVTPVWPPTGIAVASFFLLGTRVWPGVFAGALLANVTNGAGLEASGGIAVGNTLAPLLAAQLLHRVRFHAALDRVVDVVSLCTAGLLGMLVSATLGTTVLLLSNALTGSYAATWTVWWVGDAMGVVVFAPVLLTVVAARHRLRVPTVRAAETIALLALMPIVAFFLVGSVVPLWYLVIPLTLFGALRYRQPAAALSVALVSSVSILVIANGLGPFAALSTTTRLVTLQAFNATLALTVMLLTALADERARAWTELQALALDLEERVRARSDELVMAQRAIADANARQARNLRAAVTRITRLERLKTDFLRLASHELRGPVGVIRGYVQMLSDGTLGQVPESMRPAMSVVDAKAADMSRLVDQMLETARLEKVHRVTKHRLVDMAALLTTEVGAAAAVASPKHTFVIDGDGSAAVVLVDPDQVGTILRNLLDNAVRYSPDGCEIRARLDARDGMLAVAVSDSGVGIADGDVDKLFKSFSRIATRETAGIAGTGLGLYLSQKLAVLNGGDLSVTSSSPGAGSTFTLTLPLVEARASPGTPAVDAPT
jgi:signal transduction histidine kinase